MMKVSYLRRHKFLVTESTSLENVNNNFEHLDLCMHLDALLIETLRRQSTYQIQRLFNIRLNVSFFNIYSA
jgi:hypothetical protein